MRQAMVSALIFALLVLTLLGSLCWAQQLSQRPPETAPAPQTSIPPNSHPVYQQLRSTRLSGEIATVQNLVLQRDVATFTFRSGRFYFLSPVNGRVTGGVFVGDGNMTLAPASPTEQQSLSHLTKEPKFDDGFTHLMVYFTDTTYDDIKKQAQMSTGDPKEGAGPLDDANSALRTKLHHNLQARILQDVLSDRPGELFVAFPKSKRYGRLLYAVDPFPGPLNLAWEQVILRDYDEEKWGVYYSAYRLRQHDTNERTRRLRTSAARPQEQNLDVTIEKNGRLQGTAATSFTSQWDGLHVVPLKLFHTLRVQSVSDASGQPLSFIQEDKDKDPQFAIVLPRSFAYGEKFTVRVVYGGPDAVKSEGLGNYYPMARESWYPNTSFEDYATYTMRFSIPKGMQMVATGARLSDVTEGDHNVSTWKSEGPQTVAGFQFGKFKKKERKLDGMDFLVEAYANEETPDVLTDLQQRLGHRDDFGVHFGARPEVTMGNLTTTSMLDQSLAEADLAVHLYSDYFGPLPYKRLALTQQTAPNYGQAWPELVWLPVTYFFDQTIRHQLGWDDPRGYFKVVEPHEIAHQWWGHTVTWPSYRDQWMSEGFADFSASLFIQLIQKNNGEFIKFWNDQRELLTMRNKEGYRAIDVGPLTQGYRLASGKTGVNVPRYLIYPKGSYVLHMIRMMMWNPKTGDTEFKAMMHDFVDTYRNRPASTEDFKAMVEKHMTPAMDVSHNRSMDWFFNEYVYGTALPAYGLNYSFEPAPDGFVMNLKITQSGVDDTFSMLVPVYLELSKDHIVRLGAATITGNRTIEQKVPLKGLKEQPRRALLNYFDDVLSAP
jgi:hypothetical protein